MNRTPLSWIAIAIATATLAHASPSRADERDEARKLAQEGVALLESKQYRDAIARLEAAERLFHAPTNLLFMAKAYEALGEVVPAHERYVQIVLEELSRDAPKPFLEAKGEARAALTRLDSTVPGVKIAIKGTSVARVEIDGRPLPPSRIKETVGLPPGEHDIVASADGMATARAHVTTGEQGPPQAIVLELAALGGKAPPPPATRSGPSALLILGVTGVSLGGVALGVGAATGALTLSRASDIKDQCEDGLHCPPALESDAESARTLGTVSTATFIAGGIVAAAGISLLIVHAVTSGPSAVRVELAPAGVMVRGSF